MSMTTRTKEKITRLREKAAKLHALRKQVADIQNVLLEFSVTNSYAAYADDISYYSRQRLEEAEQTLRDVDRIITQVSSETLYAAYTLEHDA